MNAFQMIRNKGERSLFYTYEWRMDKTSQICPESNDMQFRHTIAHVPCSNQCNVFK